MDTVTFDEQTGMWHVHGHPEALRALTDTKTFSSNTMRLIPGFEQEADDGNIIQLDGAEHRKLRQLVSQAFTPKTVAGLEPRIRELTTELLDAADERGTLELVDDLAYPLPVTVIAELLGVPAEDRALFREWADISVGGSTDFTVRDDDGAQEAEVRDQLARLAPMFSYLHAHAAERRRTPREDLLTRLVEAEVDGEHLTDAQVVSFANVLLAAGHITTTLLLGNTVLTLDEHPAEAEEVRADPSLLPSAIEESLRLRTPFNVLARATTTATNLGGTDIPADQLLMIWIRDANRDPRVFTEPDRFDPGRTENPHLSFGRGAHFCLGAPLARLEGRVVLEVLLARYPALRTDRERPPTFLDGSTMTGVRTLPVLTSEN